MLKRRTLVTRELLDRWSRRQAGQRVHIDTDEHLAIRCYVALGRWHRTDGDAVHVLDPALARSLVALGYCTEAMPHEVTTGDSKFAFDHRKHSAVRLRPDVDTAP